MTETTEFALTTDHVKALRQADSVCFDHDKGAGDIRAIKRGKAPYYLDATVLVPAKSSVHIYGDGLDYDTKQGKTASCFAMIDSAKYSEEWQTIAGVLRVSDEIRLRWAGNDANGYLKRATVTEKEEGDGYSPGFGEHLCHDKLYLSIWRNGRQRYSFYVDDSVCPNNSARMIKP